MFDYCGLSSSPKPYCIFHLIDSDGNIVNSYGAIGPMSINNSTVVFRIDDKTLTTILDTCHEDALIFFYHWATNDLSSIAASVRYQPHIAKLYYWFARVYGYKCNIPDDQKSLLKVTATETIKNPYNASIVTGQEEDHHTVEKSFVEQAVKYGNWYVWGLMEPKVSLGVNLFILEYGCESEEVQNMRTNLLEFGVSHTTKYGKEGFK